MITIRKRAVARHFGCTDIYKKLAMVFLVFLLTACTAGRKTLIQPDGKKISITADAYIIGEVEPVTIKKVGFTMAARIDTGAQTSSLNAQDITPFERDGKRWVKFTVTDSKSGKSAEIKSKLSRTVEIKRHGGDPIERPVVKLRTVLGAVEQVREFSLADRSSFEYPILIGRNFLNGGFIVDVSRKNSTSPMTEKVNHDK